MGWTGARSTPPPRSARLSPALAPPLPSDAGTPARRRASRDIIPGRTKRGTQIARPRLYFLSLNPGFPAGGCGCMCGGWGCMCGGCGCMCGGWGWGWGIIRGGGAGGAVGCGRKCSAGGVWCWPGNPRCMTGASGGCGSGTAGGSVAAVCRGAGASGGHSLRDHWQRLSAGVHSGRLEPVRGRVQRRRQQQEQQLPRRGGCPRTSAGQLHPH